MRRQQSADRHRTENKEYTFHMNELSGSENSEAGVLKAHNGILALMLWTSQKSKSAWNPIR